VVRVGLELRQPGLGLVLTLGMELCVRHCGAVGTG